MTRRLGFIPFDMQLAENAVDRTLFSKMITDPNNLRYLLTGGIFAYREAYKRGDLYKTDKQKDLINDFLEENQDPISNFYNYLIDDHGSVQSVVRYLNGKTTDEVYTEYKKWCEDSAFHPEMAKTFTRQFSKLLPAYIGKKVISVGGAKFNSYIITGKIPK